MNKTVLLYGLLGGVLIAALKLIEYRYKLGAQRRTQAVQRGREFRLIP